MSPTPATGSAVSPRLGVTSSPSSRAPCDDVAGVLGEIRDTGCGAPLGIELDEPTGGAAGFFGLATRLLLLGTPIGVKVEWHPAT